MAVPHTGTLSLFFNSSPKNTAIKAIRCVTNKQTQLMVLTLFFFFTFFVLVVDGCHFIFLNFETCVLRFLARECRFLSSPKSSFIFLLFFFLLLCSSIHPMNYSSTHPAAAQEK
jgi:hypothetical protein